VSVAQCHLDVLCSRRYWVTDKSDGVRACLVLCRSPSTFVSVLVDRKGGMFAVSVQADEALFAGTVVDAEVVHGHDGGFVLLLFDTCCVAGRREVEHEPLSVRLKVLREVVCLALSFRRPGVAVVTKPMFDLADSAGLAAHMARLGYETDGYILTPDSDDASPPGTAPGILKLKTDHTLDFLWADGMLWFGDQTDLFPAQHLGLAFQPQQLGGVRNHAVVEMVPQTNKDGQVVMMHYLQERPDKDTPNSYVTVTRTLQSVRDNVTLESIGEALARGGQPR